MFDEDQVGSDDEDEDEESSGTSPSLPPSTSITPIATVTVPGTPTVPVITPSQPDTCWSKCTKNMTKAGKAYAEERTAAKVHLAELWDKCTHVIVKGASTQSVDPGGSSEGVTGVDGTNNDNVNSLRAIESNDAISDLTADVVIGEQAHVIEEQAHTAIRSDKRRDPFSPDYNMSIPPATYDEAIQRLDREQWLAAMNTELQTIKDMKVYELTKLPEGRKAIGCRWVLEFKDDNKGGPVYKARLVAQGFSQVPGIDYGTTFAPVIKPATVHLLAALSCQKDWEIDTFDAKRAFLWSILKEEIYMRQPKGFEQGDWRKLVWLMLCTIYGLKQSALEWYEQVCMVMSDLGFVCAESDHALFYFDGEDDVTAGITVPTVNATPTRVQCLIGWHVDDGMGVSSSRPFLEKVKKKIAERFGIKDLGLVSKYLGVQFERDRKARRLWMHQGEYISFLLEEYGLSNCNPVYLPADPKTPFRDPTISYPEVVNLRSSYLKLIGELIYLAMNMYPNVAYIVNSLAQFNADPLPRHFVAGKRILHYLAGTLNHRLQYGVETDNAELHAYADASWANEVGRRSVSGYVWFYASGLISHVSKKQTTMALSSMEAEYMAVTHVIQEGL